MNWSGSLTELGQKFLRQIESTVRRTSIETLQPVPEKNQEVKMENVERHVQTQDVFRSCSSSQFSSSKTAEQHPGIPEYGFISVDSILI